MIAGRAGRSAPAAAIAAADPMLTPYEKAAHLWRRAGFGAPARVLHETVDRGIEKTLDELLDFDREDPDLERALEALSGSVFDLANNADDARAWWLYRMLHARNPLREKLTLFWHGHFATSVAKVDQPWVIHRQIATFRRHAGATFREMLGAVARDPAMLIWLDGRTNRKGKPNENFARELMELFALGIGHYGEKDVRDAARAFTGWTIKESDFFLDEKQHDVGEKEVLGVRGNLGGDDVLDLVAAHPAAAPFLATKLCRAFVSDEPAPEYVERVAEVFRRTGGDLRSVVAAVFRDREFFAEENVRAIVKSPTEFAVSAMRVAGVEVPLRNQVVPSLRKMGQTLLAPPSVKGWDAGERWLTGTALYERANFAGVVAVTRGLPEEPRFRPKEWARGKCFATPEEVVDALAAEFLQGPVSATTRAALVEYLTPEAPRATDAKGKDGKPLPPPKAPPFVFDPAKLDAALRAAVRLLLASPEFQLA